MLENAQQGFNKYRYEDAAQQLQNSDNSVNMPFHVFLYVLKILKNNLLSTGPTVKHLCHTNPLPQHFPPLTKFKPSPHCL